ncbi:MAG: alpha-1,2-fucosyltransferase [Bacteroidales bacterium]|nr:alpha-1,2-fucosyltransferase [Bacteroidales bacterium]
MRIIVDAPGQTCNRLWSYLDTLAWAIANGKRVGIWFWDPSIRYFDALRNGKFSRFPFYSERLIKRLGEGRYLTYLFYIFDNGLLHRFYRTKLAERLGLICGWEHRNDSQWHPKVREKVLEVFRPNQNICDDVEALFDMQATDCEVIGIHIRRGDYDTFADGRFFFSLEEYAAMMRRLSAMLKEAHPEKRYRFFISTNETLNPDTFAGLDYFVNPRGVTAIHDLYGLSKCDYILGPVSTFSMWAAWYGAKKLCQVGRETLDRFALDDFKIPSGFFQNW